MANPMLNERSFNQAVERGGLGAGYGADVATGSAGGWSPPTSPTDTRAAGGPMTMRGTMSATGVLFALLLAGAAVGWVLVKTETNPLSGAREVTQFPSWIIFNVLVGFGLVLFASFKPHLSRFLAPVYAVLEGIFVGAISHVYESQYDGLVLQALGATVAVFGVMTFLYMSRIIRVTDKLRSVIMGMTFGLMLFYGVSLLINLFGGEVSFLSSASLLGIGFSVFAAGLAAFNLLLDFDIIERGVQGRAPEYMEWFAALGLLVTVVWLYLELLRLLAKLQRR